jgi:hypothetical protein
LEDTESSIAQFDPNLTKKTPEQYEQLFISNTEFFSSYNPDMIEE